MIDDDIRSVRIQGATQIAIKSLEHLMSFSSRHGFGRRFMAEAGRLESVRPTAVVLHNALVKVRADPSVETIEYIVEYLESAKLKIGRAGQRIIRNNSTVLTHCHSSEAVEIIRAAATRRRFTVIAGETRPKGQGLITVRELSRIRNVSAFFTIDSALGSCMGKQSVVLVGSDAFRKEGLVNKIGTYMLACAASHRKIRFYSAGNTFKLDSRKSLEIEARPGSEISRNMKNVSILNPAFDVTPWELVTAVVTEKGLAGPAKIKRMMR